MRAMKTLWGSCHIVRRRITYNTELARVPRELVEYVVVHELTHLKVASHGPKFYRLMDARLPGWKELRRRLNKRDFVPLGAADAPRRESAANAPRRQCSASSTSDSLKRLAASICKAHKVGSSEFIFFSGMLFFDEPKLYCFLRKLYSLFSP